MLKEKTKGVVTIATGHPYYGRMSYNLACTLKAAEPDLQVAVIFEGRALSHLSENQIKIFDQVIELPAHIKTGFGPKLYLNELSPFDETLYLDADMLWLPNKKPSDLISEFTGIEYTGITEGYYDLATDSREFANSIYYFWAEPLEIKEVYKLSEGKLYQWRSEVIYFKKTARINKFFKKAQAIHRNSKLKSQTKFGDQIPDELGINISAAINDIHPHAFKWTPAYWHKLHKDVVPDLVSLSNNWYIISFGGNFINGSATKIYDQIMKVTMNKLGIQHVFSIISKKSFAPERAKM